METNPDQTSWVRLPKAGQSCPYSGLSRASLYLITKSGKVESRKIYPSGGRRGVLLLKRASLMAFLEEQNSGAYGSMRQLQKKTAVARKAGSKRSSKGGAR